MEVDSSTSQPAGSAAVGRLTALYLNPVKSCAAQQVAAWPIGPNGFLYDREWAACGPDGQLLTQQRVTRLTQVRAEVDLRQQVLRCILKQVSILGHNHHNYPAD